MLEGLQQTFCPSMNQRHRKRKPAVSYGEMVCVVLEKVLWRLTMYSGAGIQPTNILTSTKQFCRGNLTVFSCLRSRQLLMLRYIAAQIKSETRRFSDHSLIIQPLFYVCFQTFKNRFHGHGRRWKAFKCNEEAFLSLTRL